MIYGRYELFLTNFFDIEYLSKLDKVNHKD